MIDEIQIDAEALNMTANIIAIYTKKQKDVMRDFLSKFTALIPNWNDDETFSPLINEINRLRNEVTTQMEIIEATYPSYFRAKAESITSRPVFGGHSQSTYTSPSLQSSSSASSSSYSRVSMETKRLDIKSLNKEMCAFDNVGNIDGYVRSSSNGRRISELNNVGQFLSPTNGQPIYCKTIAWRSIRSVEESNSYNVCGADFYYADGTYCGTYTGKNWQDIFNFNYSDTKKFR